MLDNYRKCLLLIKNNSNDLQNVCKCSENSENQIIYESIKINLDYCLQTDVNNQESSDVNTIQDFGTNSDVIENQMSFDSEEELEMNGKSSSKTSKDCHNFTITEIQLNNETNADIGVSLETQHSSEESFDKSLDKNKKTKKVYEYEIQICMYCQKSLQNVAKKDKSKGEEGWYHRKCRNIDYNIKKKEGKTSERCLFCQKSICISDQQLENNKEREQSYHKSCFVEFKGLIDSIELQNTSNGCEGGVKPELGTENIEFYEMNENTLNSTPVSDEVMESNEAVEQISHNKSSEVNKFEERLSQLDKNRLWLQMNNRFDCLGAEGTDYNSDEPNVCNDNQLNSSLDFQSNDKCVEELTTESENVSSNRIKFGKSIHICPQKGCGNHFIAHYDLVRHIRSKHKNESILLKTDDYTHVCAHEGCGKRFNTPCHLIDHIRAVHLFEKPFKCDECDRSFPGTRYLMRHKRTSHPEERLTCDWPECGRVYKIKKAFDDHKRRHLGVRAYQCKYEGCAKRFFAIKALTNHHNTHSKRFVCLWPECNDRFSMKKSLTSHLNKHQNIKPFKCTFSGCGKDFYGDSQLMHHNWSFHRDQYEPKGGWVV